MGTLTANQARLPEHCDHKLPTSCRLSSISRCCACADERAHSAAYSTYIDGVGFVPRGTRWNRYCWFCKEFWENRVRAAGLTPAQTRVPEVPDQTQFLERWYEFHRGHRTVRNDDGSQERVAVLGEDFKNVSPGCLPRTLEELRAGREGGDAAEQFQQQPLSQTVASFPGMQEQESLEDTLDQMLQAASAEEAEQDEMPQQSQNHISLSVDPVPPRSNTIGVGGLQSSNPPDAVNHAEREGSHPETNIHAQAMAPAGSRSREYQSRRIAALRRELDRMRHGIERVISGLRDLGEDVPDHTQAIAPLTRLGRTLDVISGVPTQEDAQRVSGYTVPRADGGSATIEARVQGARQHEEHARRMREQADSEADLAREEHRTSMERLQRVQRDQRTAENYARVFGTREEMVAQGENYESPIGGMFTRAMERFRAAEELRRDERTLRQVLIDENRSGGEGAVERLTEMQARERDVWGVPVPQVRDMQDGRPLETEASLATSGALSEDRTQQSIRRESASIDIAGDHQRIDRETTPTTDDFPRNTLDGIVMTREPEDEQDPADMVASVDLFRESRAYVIEEGASEVMQAADLLASYRTNPQRSNVEHVLLCLADDDALREIVDCDIGAVYRMVINRHYNRTTAADRDRLRSLLQDSEFLWRIALPSLRAAGLRLLGRTRTFAAGNEVAGMARLLYIEGMAEAYQISSALRRASDLPTQQQLRMLYRLQAGERSLEDRTVLDQLLRSPHSIQLARDAQRVYTGEVSARERLTLAQFEQDRQHAAQQGNHTRQELDRLRRATANLAFAAGRTATQSGSQGVLEQLPSAYQHPRNRGTAADPEDDRALEEERAGTASDSDFEGDLDEAQGLDALNTGRPEPKTDDEMTVKLECRICYSQVADIACLPCGHLVMCSFCSELHSPVMAHDRTRPARAAGCPVCRKNIRQKVRVFRA